MAEYICREATVKAFCEKCKGYYDGHCVHRGECDIDVIQTAPAADVQPVKHGEWKINSDGYYPYCSVCGTAADQLTKHLTKYCPECGARMDGDKKC